MNILFFDTETNGKPKRYNASMADVDNWPRVTQLAWQIAEAETEKLIKVNEYLVKPKGWTIPKEEFFINNNMSTERCEEFGTPIEHVLDIFLHHINQYEIDVIVAHNLDFDINVLGAEMLRIKVKPSRSPQKICTMKSSTNICRLPGGRNGEYKWPRLEELYSFLFNENIDGAHDALMDVSAMRRCFFELVKRGVIRIGKDVPVNF